MLDHVVRPPENPSTNLGVELVQQSGFVNEAIESKVKRSKTLKSGKEQIPTHN
jgi:hypothetical protein